MANPSDPFSKQAPISGIKKVILVGSGKGGVGKSTVASNLAVSLAKEGCKTGLLDADIYGPSIPRMLGALNQKPEFTEQNKLHPIIRYHVKMMSIGFLIDEDLAVIWRGPMLFKAIDQFLRDVEWGELDVLVVDLPPGTGDVQLTIAQRVPVSGAIVVCTPQNIALHDVKKSIDMFQRVGIPIWGLVENMSCFLAPGQSEPFQLFPRGELDAYLTTKSFTKLAEIPFYPPAALGSEAGIPVVESDPTSVTAMKFRDLAKLLIEKHGLRA